MTRTSVFVSPPRRRVALRLVAALLAVVLVAVACGGADEPALVAERPPTPKTDAQAAVQQQPPDPDAPEPITRTTEPTIVVAPPPVVDDSGRVLPPPDLPDVPLSDEINNPDLTVLPPEELPPPPPPLPPPTQAPAWQPTTVLVSHEDVNRIVPVYDAPNGTRLSFPDGDLWSYTYRGNRLVLRVVEGAQGDEWAKAELPVRPSGVQGWIRTEDFNWSTVNHHITIDVSDRSVTLYNGDELVASTRAIVGRPNTPTPTLAGFVVEKLPNHAYEDFSAVLGDWVLMLSFFSEALNSFGGGLPRIALHGTHIPERVGEALSNGCIRIPNNIIETIAQQAPLGTAVNVVA